MSLNARKISHNLNICSHLRGFSGFVTVWLSGSECLTFLLFCDPCVQIPYDPGRRPGCDFIPSRTAQAAEHKIRMFVRCELLRECARHCRPALCTGELKRVGLFVKCHDCGHCLYFSLLTSGCCSDVLPPSPTGSGGG